MSTWEKYSNERLITKHLDSFYLVKPEKSLDNDPIFCPVCDYIMNSFYDQETYTKFKCCDNCANEWVYSNRENWNLGWRPTSEEINNKIKNRPI